MKGVLVLLNSFTFILVLVVNYFSATQAAQTVGDVSRKYDTLFTPAGYAFSIWGLIYILLLCFLAYQWYSWLSKRNNEIIKRTGIWFSFANVSNAGWVVVWTNEYLGLSVLLILVLLACLIILTVKLDMELYDAPFPVLVLVWWPLTIYFGWTVLATVANISAFLVGIGWEGGLVSPEIWMISLILLSTGLYLLLIYTRNMREAALVGIWGLTAIAVRHWGESDNIAWTAAGAAIVLFIYISVHGYRNRATSPVNKWRDWKKG